MKSIVKMVCALGFATGLVLSTGGCFELQDDGAYGEGDGATCEERNFEQCVAQEGCGYGCFGRQGEAFSCECRAFEPLIYERR